NGGLAVGGVGAALIVDLASPRSFETLYVLDALSFIAFVPIALALRLPSPAASANAPEDEPATEPADAPPTRYRDLVSDPLFRALWVLTAVLVAVGYAQDQAAFPVFATGAGALTARELAIAMTANTVAVVVLQLVVLRLLAGQRRSRCI